MINKNGVEHYRSTPFLFIIAKTIRCMIADNIFLKIANLLLTRKLVYVIINPETHISTC